MPQSNVLLVQTATSNTASVLAAFRRAGTTLQRSQDPHAIQHAPFVVLPGVGAFGAAVHTLQQAGLIEPLRQRILQGRPTFAICLGLQLLCARSQESPDAQGLGVIPGQVTRFQGVPRIPQFGWSQVTPSSPQSFFTPGYAYFANAYCLRQSPDGWDVATSQYGGDYVAAIAKDAVVACQFHPELSGEWGHQLICRWLSMQPTLNAPKGTNDTKTPPRPTGGA